MKSEGGTKNEKLIINNEKLRIGLTPSNYSLLIINYLSYFLLSVADFEDEASDSYGGEHEATMNASEINNIVLIFKAFLIILKFFG